MQSLVTLTCCCLTLATAIAEPIDPSRITVIDGDTIPIDQASPSIRLIGLNDPETARGKYACQTEHDLGVRARSRLRELVKLGDLDFKFAPCSGLPGTESKRSCNYGRRCGTLRSHGQDVGDILITEKLAVSFVCGATRCPKTPRSWCSRE